MAISHEPWLAQTATLWWVHEWQLDSWVSTPFPTEAEARAYLEIVQVVPDYVLQGTNE